MPTLPNILSPGDRDQAEKAVQHLQRYFGLNEKVFYTGSRFERLAGGGDRTAVANVITAEDIVSLSMLSIRVHGATAQQLLENNELISDVAASLSEIPTDLDLVNASAEVVSAGSPADALWRQLRDLPRVGQVTASKLMARKRPRLIPVYDQVIARAFAMNGSGAQWTFWHQALHANDRALHDHLLTLRSQAGLPEEINALRVLDVIVWMEHRHPNEERDETSQIED